MLISLSSFQANHTDIDLISGILLSGEKWKSIFFNNKLISVYLGCLFYLFRFFFFFNVKKSYFERFVGSFNTLLCFRPTFVQKWVSCNNTISLYYKIIMGYKYYNENDPNVGATCMNSSTMPILFYMSMLFGVMVLNVHICYVN